MRDRLLTVLLTIFLAGVGGVGAQAPRTLINEVYDPLKAKTKLDVIALFDQLPPSGYLPVRVSITNNFKTERNWKNVSERDRARTAFA